jgi:hypothetical protein
MFPLPPMILDKEIPPIVVPGADITPCRKQSTDLFGRKMHFVSGGE